MSFVDFSPLFRSDLRTAEAKNDLLYLATESARIGCALAVKALRESGMSFQDIADEFGYGLSMISYIGAGRKVFGVRSYEKMSARFLHRSVHEILTGDKKGIQLTVIPTLMMNIMEPMDDKRKHVLVSEMRDKYSEFFTDESADPDITSLMRERLAELGDHRCCAEDRILYASGRKLVKSEPYEYSAYQNSLRYSLDRILLGKIDQPAAHTVLSCAVMLNVPADYFLVRDYTKTADWIEYYQEKENGPSPAIIQNPYMLDLLSMWLLLPDGKREELAADVMLTGSADGIHPVTVAPKNYPNCRKRSKRAHCTEK